MSVYPHNNGHSERRTPGDIDSDTNAGSTIRRISTDTAMGFSVRQQVDGIRLMASTIASFMNNDLSNDELNLLGKADTISIHYRGKTVLPDIHIPDDDNVTKIICMYRDDKQNMLMRRSVLYSEFEGNLNQAIRSHVTDTVSKVLVLRMKQENAVTSIAAYIFDIDVNKKPENQYLPL